MQVIRCDNKGSCQRIGELPALGWIVLGAIPEQEPPEPRSLIDHLAGPGVEPVIAGTFCSWECVAEYATTNALIKSAERGPGE